METLHEECAVFGVSLRVGEEAPGLCYNGLLALQHRGQEGPSCCGMWRGAPT